MAKKFDSARVRVKVPERRWKNRAEVEAWARERLAGGPPSLEATVPDGHPQAGKPASWGDLKDGTLSNHFVILESDPPGLIVTDTETGERKFVPSASKSGLVLGKTKPDEFISSIRDEQKLRAFVKEENATFNKNRQKQAERQGGNWAIDWYRHGRRVKQFVRENPKVSTERVWQELVRWGQGQAGYSRQAHQDATYFYEWIGEAGEDHPIFRLGTTRIQHILRGDRTKVGRDRLLAAIISGPMMGFSDDEFAWLTGQRSKNWPLDDAGRQKFAALGECVRKGEPLSQGDVEEISKLLHAIRRARTSTS